MSSLLILNNLAITFDYSSSKYKMFDEELILSWICKVIKNENYVVGDINYYFVTEQEILEINRSSLKHDYFTDIITFDYVFVNIINGDIFVSLDTVLTNSQKLQFLYEKEMYRVIIHGIMHLCGYKDHSIIEKEKMRSLEEKYLAYLETF